VLPYGLEYVGNIKPQTRKSREPVLQMIWPMPTSQEKSLNVSGLESGRLQPKLKSLSNQHDSYIALRASNEAELVEKSEDYYTTRNGKSGRTPVMSVTASMKQFHIIKKEDDSLEESEYAPLKAGNSKMVKLFNLSPEKEYLNRKLNHRCFWNE
jgi:hypothetical protein